MKGTFVLCKDWISYTNEMSVEDKGILLDVIMRYQNGMDIGDPPYAIKIVFAHIKSFFVSQEERYTEKVLRRNQENGKKGGRPTQKKPKKPTGLGKTQSDVLVPKQPNGEIVDGEAKKKFGNEDVNEIMEIIKEYNDGVVNGTDAKQRQFANNLIKKLKEIKSVEEGTYTWQSILKVILEIVKDDQYYSTKIGSPELIFYNLASLMQVCRTKLKKDNKGTKQF